MFVYQKWNMYAYINASETSRKGPLSLNKGLQLPDIPPIETHLFGELRHLRRHDIIWLDISFGHTDHTWNQYHQSSNHHQPTHMSDTWISWFNMLRFKGTSPKSHRLTWETQHLVKLLGFFGILESSGYHLTTKTQGIRWQHSTQKNKKWKKTCG